MVATQFSKLFSRIPKFITGLTLLAFVILAFIGMFDCTNAIMQNGMITAGQQHAMADCVPGKNCGMDLNEHLGIWQGMFTAPFSSDVAGFFVALLVLVGATAAIFKTFSLADAILLRDWCLYYERNHRDNKLYNYLVSIFSSGIIQPKLFA